MNAHWVKWVSVLSLALAGTLAACSVSSDDDDDNNNTSGNGGRGGNAGAAGGNVSGNGGAGGGVSGAGGGGGNPPAASPPRDRAGVIAALNARKYDPEGGDSTQNAAVAPKWVCEDAPVEPTPDAEDPSPHGLARTCSNFQLAGVIFDDCDDGVDAGFNPNAASVKEQIGEDGKISGWFWYVKDTNGKYYWFNAPAKDGPNGVKVVDEANTGSPLKEGFDRAECEGCHSKGQTEFVRKGSTIIARDDAPQLLQPTPNKCGVPDPELTTPP